MTDLHFSAEAIEKARATMRVHHGTGGAANSSHECDECFPVALSDALAHDAERLAREIIEQRVAAIDDREIAVLHWMQADGAPTWRAELLRALTAEQPT